MPRGLHSLGCSAHICRLQGRLRRGQPRAAKADGLLLLRRGSRCQRPSSWRCWKMAWGLTLHVRDHQTSSPPRRQLARHASPGLRHAVRQLGRRCPLQAGRPRSACHARRLCRRRLLRAHMHRLAKSCCCPCGAGGRPRVREALRTRHWASLSTANASRRSSMRRLGCSGRRRRQAGELRQSQQPQRCCKAALRHGRSCTVSSLHRQQPL